jgi:hypothetical protein
MTLRTKLATTATVIVVLGASGVAIAQTTRSEERVTGPEAVNAEKAALKVVPDGRVVGVEIEDGGRQGWEVEVSKPDGRQLEVHLTPELNSDGIESDDNDANDDD